MLKLIDKLFNVIMMHVKINVINYITIIFIDIYVNIMTKSFVRYMNVTVILSLILLTYFKDLIKDDD